MSRKTNTSARLVDRGVTHHDEGGEIILLPDGWLKIRDEGTMAFLNFIETGKREFFKAKEFVALYDLVFKMCIQRDPYNWSQALYEKYTDSITEYLQSKVKPALNAAIQSYDAAFLKEWKNRFANHKLVVKGFSKLFMYLDRFYTPNTDGVLKLDEQGYKLYKEEIFDKFHSHARTAILNSIDHERNAESQDRFLLQEAVDVFVTMGYAYNNRKLELYVNHLEKNVVEHAAQHYKRKSVKWLEEEPCPNYLAQAEAMLQAERGRVEAYLNRNSLKPLESEVYRELLKEHQKDLLLKKTGLDHLLSSAAMDDLSRLFRLYKYDPADLEPIAAQFQEHVKNKGLEVVQKAQSGASAAAGEGTDAEDAKAPVQAAAAQSANSSSSSSSSSSAPAGSAAAPVLDSGHELVKNLIDLHQRYNLIVTKCFESHQLMQKSLKRAFEEFINKDNRVSKLLAKYVHDVLKKGNKLNIKDVEMTLDNVVFLYGYIQEKDIFERDYQLFLSKRLLSGQCESEHSEKSMIAKLKRECGYQWTNKLEGMFKDVQLSKELMQEFKKHLNADSGLSSPLSQSQANSADLDIQLDTSVCTTGYWPTSRVFPSLKHPKELLPICDKFKRFYLNRHSGHKLEWRLDQGQAEVQVEFKEGVAASRRALVVTTYQMMILLVFNAFDSRTKPFVTFKQLQDITGIPPAEMANHLLSMAHPKVGVILKNPNNRKLEDDHKFMLNKEYKSSLMKIQIPLLQAAEGTEDKNDEESRIIELQRRHQIDAAVVRIMKSRKKLAHQQLVNEVVAQLSARFKPTSNDIKKRIEALIEQEYLERDANDRATYNYLA